MTLDQWADSCLRAIKVNYASRNQAAFANRDLHLRQLRLRRKSIRQWVAQLRLVRNPITAQAVERTVRFRVH